MGEEVEVEATDLQLVKIFHSKNKVTQTVQLYFNQRYRSGRFGYNAVKK